tara:strand:+ start:2855 stop:8125 length:5271 start_codon:yes stop_codon:yes gene_type:complete
MVTPRLPRRKTTGGSISPRSFVPRPAFTPIQTGDVSSRGGQSRERRMIESEASSEARGINEMMREVERQLSTIYRKAEGATDQEELQRLRAQMAPLENILKEAGYSIPTRAPAQSIFETGTQPIGQKEVFGTPLSEHAQRAAGESLAKYIPGVRSGEEAMQLSVAEQTGLTPLELRAAQGFHPQGMEEIGTPLGTSFYKNFRETGKFTPEPNETPKSFMERLGFTKEGAREYTEGITSVFPTMRPYLEAGFMQLYDEPYKGPSPDLPPKKVRNILRGDDRVPEDTYIAHEWGGKPTQKKSSLAGKFLTNDQERRQFLLETNPAGMQSLLDLQTPSLLEAATFGLAKPVTKLVKASKPIVQSIPGADVASNASAAFKKSVRDTFYENIPNIKVTPVQQGRMVQQTEGTPVIGPLDPARQEMVNAQMTFKPAKRILESRLGKFLPLITDPKKLVTEFIRHDDPRINPNHSSFNQKISGEYRNQNLLAREEVHNKADSMGSIYSIKLQDDWESVGFSVSDDATVQVLLRSDPKAGVIDIGWEDLLSQPMRYLRADGTDLLEQDSFWEFMGEVRKIIDDVEFQWEYAMDGPIPDKFSYGKLSDKAFWMKADPSAIARETGISFDAAKKLVAKHADNPEELARYRSGYIPRGPAVSPDDTNWEDKILGASSGFRNAIRSRETSSYERVWKGPMIDSIESGNQYGTKPGHVLGGWMTGMWRSVADINLNDALRPTADWIIESEKGAIRRTAEARLGGVKKMVDEISGTMSEMIRGKTFVDTYETTEIPIQKALNDAGISLDEAKLIARNQRLLRGYQEGRLLSETMGETEVARWRPDARMEETKFSPEVRPDVEEALGWSSPEAAKMLDRWAALPPRLRRLLISDPDSIPSTQGKLAKGGPRTSVADDSAMISVDRVVKNKQLEQLHRDLEPEQYELLLKGQNIKDPSLRTDFLRKSWRTVERSVNEKRMNVESAMNDRIQEWKRADNNASVKDRDAFSAKQIQDGQNFLQTRNMNNMGEYLFDEKTQKHIDSRLADPAAGWKGVFTKFNDWSRMLVLTGDNAAPFNQGLYLLARAPAAWMKVMGKTQAALVEPKYWEKQIVKHFDDYKEMVENGSTFEQSSEWFAGARHTETARVMMRDLEEKIGTKGYIDKIIRRMGTELRSRPEASFKILRDEGRRELYLSLKPVYEAEGKSLTELTGFVDNLIGTSKGIGIRSKQRSIESGLMLARGYYRAHLAVLGSALQGGIRGQQARESLSKLMMSQLSIHTFLARQTGQDVNLDPSDPHFMQIEIDGVWIGIPGFQRSVIRLIGDLMQETAENVDPDRFATFPREGGPFGNPAIRWLRGKASGSGRAITTILDQEDFTGNDITNPGSIVATIGRDAFLPIIMKDLVVENPSLPLWAAPLSFNGMLTRQPSHWGELGHLMDERAEELGLPPYTMHEAQRLGVKKMSSTEKEFLLSVFPDLRDADTNYMQSIEETEGRGFAAIFQQYNVHLNDHKDEQVEGLHNWIRTSEDKYAKGDLGTQGFYSTRRLPEELVKLGKSRADIRDQLIKNSPEVSDYFNRLDKEEPLNTTADSDLILQDYYSDVTFHPDLSSENQEHPFFDYQKYSELESAWVEKWNHRTGGKGEEVWWEVQKMMKYDPDMPEVVREWHDARLSLKGYWQVGEELAKRYGVLNEWRQSKTDVLKEPSDTIKQIDRIVEETRRQVRSSNRYIDIVLFRFGLTSTLQNEENQREFDTEEKMQALISFSGFSSEPYRGE